MLQRMTRSEEQVMRVLWQSDQPLSCAEIVELSGDKTWKDSYVHSLIKSLTNKGMVTVGAFELVSRSYARKFAPKISYAEYVLLSSFSEEDFQDTEMMTAFCETFWRFAGSEALRKRIKHL